MDYSQSFPYVNLFHPSIRLTRKELLLYPFYKLINWGAEEQEISTVIQLLSSKKPSDDPGSLSNYAILPISPLYDQSTKRSAQEMHPVQNWLGNDTTRGFKEFILKIQHKSLTKARLGDYTLHHQSIAFMAECNSA